MAVEIERKFLVDEAAMKRDPRIHVFKNEAVHIHQGYLFDIRNHVGRIRVIRNGKSYFTYKGPTVGVSRTEIEFRIPSFIGKALLKYCNKVLYKTRLTVAESVCHCDCGTDLLWEIDTFYNLDAKLIIAEIELPREDTEFTKPSWIREEVSHDPQYYNSNLIKRIK